MRVQVVIGFLTVALAALIVGCGGQQAALSPSGGSGAAAPKGLGSATFTLSIPGASSASAQRSAQYISAGTQSISIAVNSGTPTTANLTPGSPNCSTGGSGLQCSLTVAAPIGNDTFAISLYSGTNGTGSVLSSATISGTVNAASANTFPITFNGTVASIAVSVTNGNDVIPGGYATTLPVVVTAKDASGNIIVGPGNYTNPITLTNADTSGSITTLSTTTVTSPSTVVTLAYNPTDANTGVLDINGLPVGATQIGASASGVSGANVTPGTFQYIADVFFGFNHTRTLTGTGTVTITSYNSTGTPSPNPSTWNYSITTVDISHPGATFNGVSSLIDSHKVVTYTQTSPVTSASPEVQTIDFYQAVTLAAPAGGPLYRYGAVQADVNSGPTASPITLGLDGAPSLPGTTTSTETFPVPGQEQIDVLPHVTTNWNDSSVPLSVVDAGAQISTEQINADGSGTYSESFPATEIFTVTASGIATNFNVFGAGLTVNVGLPIPNPTGTPGDVIPVTEEVTSPAPGPTSTYFPVDWYPGGGAPQLPLDQSPVSESLTTIPASCNVPSSIGTQAWAIAYQLNNLTPWLFHVTTRTETEYYIPGGIGWVCTTWSRTENKYSLVTGIIDQQIVQTYTYGVQSTSALSVHRRP